MASSPRVAKALADALRRAKDGLSSAAAMELRATVDFWWPEGAELTDEIVDAICDVVEVYANDASGYAAQYFAESVGETSDVTPADCYRREWTEQAVRSAAAELEGQPHSVIARRLADHASRMVGRSAGEYVIQSARKHRRPSSGDAAGVRFARVPGGSETCSFCLMLASRGWVYWSRETAGEFDHYHEGCQCTVVASNESHPALEDYDPDGMYERYLKCSEAVEGSAGGAVDTRAVLREMERRDPEWLRTGEPSPVDESIITAARKKKLERTGEWKTIERLSAQGISVQPQNEDKAAAANIDLKIRGRYWESKAFSGKGSGLRRRIAEAVSKWERLWKAGESPASSVPRIVIDISESTMAGNTANDIVSECIEYHANRGVEIAEILIVRKGGGLTRIKG